MFNLDTYDHAMYMHFHLPVDMTFSTCLLVINYDFDTISCAARLPPYNIIFPLFCNHCSFVLLLTFHYIAIHNIMLHYKPVKPYSLKMKVCF